MTKAVELRYDNAMAVRLPVLFKACKSINDSNQIRLCRGEKRIRKQAGDQKAGATVVVSIDYNRRAAT